MKTLKPMLVGLAAMTAVCANAFHITGDGNSEYRNLVTRSALVFTTNGTFTVTGSGTIELLMVGGGGGGGVDAQAEGANQGGAGGGAGGLVHKESFAVSPGVYTVTIGAGGEAFNSDNADAAMGGDTVLARDSATLLTAFGGGYGARHGGVGADGGSGGGGMKSMWSSAARAGGQAIHGEEDNLGFDGGTSTHTYTPGGGGGAGGTATRRNDENGFPGYGGPGLPFSITGTEVWYAGGGGAWNRGNVGLGGQGGGGNGHSPGVDGLGGGGGANAKGGSGVLILSFVPTSEGGDFGISVSSGAIRYRDGDDMVVIVRDSADVTVTGSGAIELLMVGGGGGGGESRSNSNYGAAGGGAGGYVHFDSVSIVEGSYHLSVGAGGELGANGGNTTAFGLTAYGGGFGAGHYGPGGDGGSGGGAHKADWSGNYSGGAALYGAEYNLGNPGGDSNSHFNPAGGGGAGGPSVPHPNYDGGYPGRGGVGVTNDITGIEICYAGGGGAWTQSRIGLGGDGGGGAAKTAGIDGLGGGGGADARGGSGVIVFRYPITGTIADTGDFAVTSEDVVLLHRGTNGVFVVTNDARMVVTGSGEIELLMVGGGGGGGADGVGEGIHYGGAGGGAGGLVHFDSLFVSAGEYDIRIGAGGGIDTNGGNTVAFGFTAYGGAAGRSSAGGGDKKGLDGGSGGGGVNGYWDANKSVIGGKAIYSYAFNKGNDGCAAQNHFSPGGGGGAGGPALLKDPGNPVKPGYGGEGLPFSITGEEVWYAGGGGGWANGSRGLGGRGGGGDGGVAGIDGLGGGGGGCAKGGDGVVIIRFKRKLSGLLILVK